MASVFKFLYLALSLAAAVNAAAIASPHHGSPRRGHAKPKAIYFMTNDASNNIVALPVAHNGTLAAGSYTLTGGAGGNAVGSTGQPDGPDALGSQGAVRVVNSMLFNVNPGSSTVSMFTIDPANPTKLTMVGKPADTAGDFPVTMAVSTKHQLVCAANAGAKAGISCGKFSPSSGLGPMQPIAAFNLNQTTPPQGPLNGPADTFFNNDETALITTVKGDPTVNNTGFLSVLPIVKGTAKGPDTRSSPAGTAVLFGTVPIPGTKSVLATDASFGAAVLKISPDTNQATIQAKLDIADQKATCWATVSSVTNSGFVTDVGVNHLVEMDLTTGALIKELNVTNGNPGMIDLEAGGNFIYALSPGAANISSAVAVFDVSGGWGSAKAIQNFNPTGVNVNAQGMALYV